MIQDAQDREPSLEARTPKQGRIHEANAVPELILMRWFGGVDITQDLIGAKWQVITHHS